ncbi:MAG: hypothetical protein K2Y56_14240 [Methylobacterium sp.]|uniref:hypothetical protein n=1 Tax=Methylobacterium sp. TaxID=409 RepID=UPI0025D75437|nr:hypothetical protein [Methylobacterium sp.]MBX9932679.1 hypothetical protein [Methylobacterium sp.]
MTRSASLACAFVFGLAAPAPASPCGDAITALDGQVKAQARTAISASTSGKAAAGAREGEGEAGGVTGSAVSEKSAQAGEGGDKAMQARVALDEARTADKKGDRAGCEAAVARARAQLATAP